LNFYGFVVAISNVDNRILFGSEGIAMQYRPLLILLAYIAMLLLSQITVAQQYRGVNLAGGEFGSNKVKGPGVYGKHYIYPSPREIMAFKEMGATVFRLPIRWGRVQYELGAPLVETEMARIDKVIQFATDRKIAVIIDVHNYGKYKGESIGTGAVSLKDFDMLWQLIAERYRRNPLIIFGLMNEPFDIAAETWVEIVQSATNAIRKTGAKNLILVPGTAWSGAHSWRKQVVGISNAVAMEKFKDPIDNFAFEFHQYFDWDSSGTSTNCVKPEEAQKRIMVATKWLEEVGSRGFLAEFALSDRAECLELLKSTLEHIQDHKQWIGWTYWASSSWFGDYPFNVFPFQERRPSQLLILQDFLLAPR
jgi:endoglucanase